MSVIYRVTWNAVGGSYGYLTEYRDLTNSGAWTIPSTSPNPTLNTYYDLVLDTGIQYAVRVSSNGLNCVKKFTIILIDVPAGACCPGGYTISPDETFCFQINSAPPTVLQSNICLAPSQLATQYSGSGTYIYNPGYNTDLSGTKTLLTTGFWKECVGCVTGPMNRDAIWVDTDCNGVKDPLTAGEVLQITIPVTGTAGQVLYVGIGGDNTFRLDINGVTIVDRDNTFLGDNFNFWHLFPVTLVSGTNYFNFRAVGDGTTNDSFATVIYDNTYTQLTSATSMGGLDIVFRTIDLVGSHIDIATCPTGYFLDTTGGSGSYSCIQYLSTSTISC